MITKELLEQKIIEATRKRESAIAAANGAIAEIATLKELLAEFPIEPLGGNGEILVGEPVTGE